MQHILGTGGTGTLGRLVVARLRDGGRTLRVLSWRSHDGGEGIEFGRGDLATGEGALRAGANLNPDRAVGRRTWEALSDQVLSSSDCTRMRSIP